MSTITRSHTFWFDSSRIIRREEFIVRAIWGGGGGRRTSECLTNIDRLITATKVSLDLNDSSSDNLGMAAVIIHDLKQKRTRDYEFNWNIALDVSIEKHQPINFLYDLTAKK